MPVLEVLIVAGVHVPVMPLFDVPDSTGGVENWQMVPMVLNTGSTAGFIAMVIDVLLAHCPAIGVNV